MKKSIFGLSCNSTKAFVLIVSAFLTAGATAQDFQSYKSNNARVGYPTLSPSTPPLTLPQVYNNPGRSFLRWWDPVQQLRKILDTGEVGTAANPLVDWTFPGIGYSPLAFNYIQNDILNPAYAFARTVPALDFDNPTLPAAGFTTASYSFTFTGLAPSQDYQAYINVPVGPTDTDPNPAVTAAIFPQRYLVVQVSGIENGPFTQIIDAFTDGGSLVKLGGTINFTSELVTVDPGGQIVITVFNTVPRSTGGGFLDPLANPTNEVVYADAAMIVGQAGGVGDYIASPVISELTATPPIGGAVQFPIRVVSPRNETTFVGDLDRDVTLGVITSFTHDGVNVFDPTGTGRKNMVFSWPFKRQHGNSGVEQTRAATDRQAWIMGPNPANTRAVQIIQSDNLNGSFTGSAGFFTQTILTNYIGEDYVEAPAVVGVTTSSVRWAPVMPEAFYKIQVWLPDLDTGLTLARTAQYEILQGASVIDVVTVDQSLNSGWLTLPGQPDDGYEHDPIAALSVRLLDKVTSGTDAGRNIYADAVRFVRESDLAIESTPVQTKVNIRLSDLSVVQRDVLIVAMENGRIYCVDAHGDPVTGDPPTVYWVYPSEDPLTDPNHVAIEDGKDGIAETPVAFNLSSALVQNVGGEDRLYIGSMNGRVYCLDMTGRGDGTTTRRWTYPDEYNPTTPTAPIAPSTLGEIAGSVAYGTGTGLPTIYVPTTQGRLFALDALGNAATKTTTVQWQYPAAAALPVGEIYMAPTVAFGNVYFGGGVPLSPINGGFYAVSEATGLLVWQSLGTGSGNFIKFFESSPVAAAGTMITGGGPFAGVDAMIFMDTNGRVVSLDAATGAFQWETNELGLSTLTSPVFTYQTVYDNLGVLQVDVPVVVFSTWNSRLVSILADGSVNAALRRQVWGYTLEGDDQVSSPIVGGKTAFETHSWMYVGDSNGTFFAFNHDPGLPDNGQDVSDGDIPGGYEVVDNDPTGGDINGILDPASIHLLVPEAYDDLYEKMQDGTLTYADLTNAATTMTAIRRNFEFGETLYMLVYNMPELGGSLANYFVEFQMTNSLSSSRVRQIQTRLLTAGVIPGGSERFVLAALPILASGSASVIPGATALQIRAVAPGQRSLRSAPYNLNFVTANPLGLAFEDETGTIVQSVGNTDDATDPMAMANGSPGTDQGVGLEPATSIRTALTALLGDPVGHGTLGISRALVIDRSLLNLIYGTNRGIQGVRLAPSEVSWNIDAINPTGGVIKPLTDNLGMTYPGSEDYPTATPNISLDYPDVNRDRFTASKSTFGFAENPIHTGVGLTPPLITPLDLANYRTADPVTGYDAQMTRTLQSTIFDLGINVPRYQPPSSLGYYGSHNAYVTGDVPGFSAATQSYRTFGTDLDVAIDERLTVDTPTVDLGSLSAGGGFNGSATFGPLQPWDPTSLFSPWNANYNSGAMQMFSPFRVFNEGNVNMLNVRVAKELDVQQILGRLYRPVELFAPGQHELAWLDAPLHMFSDLDPRFSGTAIAVADPESRNILQKARPNDVAPTQLSVNPRSRPNPYMRASGNYLLNTTLVPPGDPKIGVTAPIGTPTGDYLRRIYIFEDKLLSNRRPDLPSLAEDESYTDPGMNLKFTVSETRFTSRASTKSAPSIESNIIGNESFKYSNITPSALRDFRGNLFVAHVSDRVDAANVPGWDTKPKLEADTALDPQWRIYVSSLLFNSAIVPADTRSPIGDFNGWSPSDPNKWFNRAVSVAFPTALPSVLFTTGASETLVPGSEAYGAPAFPSSGSFDQLDYPDAAGRNGFADRYMAFLGDVVVEDSAGNRRQQEQLFVSSLNFAANGDVTENGVAVGMPYDLDSSKSKPSLIQRVYRPTSGPPVNYATVFYTTSSTGFGRVNYSTFDESEWTPPNSLDMGNAFESVGSPSAVLRRYQNRDQDDDPLTSNTVIDVTFAGNLRGRAFSEVFITRLSADDITGAPVGDQPHRVYGPRIDELELDPSTSLYWSPGAVWRLARNDLVINNPVAPFNPTEEFIDLFQLVAGNYVSILDKARQEFDRETGVLTFPTTLGGRVYIESKTGSVRFSGALVPRTLRLYVRYAPTYYRVSTGPGANYRTVGMVYDDRFIGIYQDATDPLRNLVGDLSYWGNEFNVAANATDLLRWDRNFMTFTRTSGDGTQATRPFMASTRLGIKLPAPVQLAADGSLTSFTVQWIDQIGLPGAERFYQVDPATGRLFFLSGMEDRRVRVTYAAVDESGNPIGVLIYEANVEPLVELREEAIPIERAGNESSLNIAMDPLNGLFNRDTYRRPSLYWFFWTSTRNGPPDIYFETVAPRFTPKPPNP